MHAKELMIHCINKLYFTQSLNSLRSHLYKHSENSFNLSLQALNGEPNLLTIHFAHLLLPNVHVIRQK